MVLRTTTVGGARTFSRNRNTTTSLTNENNSNAQLKDKHATTGWPAAPAKLVGSVAAAHSHSSVSSCLAELPSRDHV
jgi:hypothetical protein